jgi:hypothetical protein
MNSREIRIRAQPRDYRIGIAEIADRARAAHQNDLLEALVGLRILDEPEKRSHAGTGRKHEQPLARPDISQNQRAGRLRAHQDRIARLNVLEPRGQRSLRDLDAVELQELFIARAREAVGTHELAAARLEADHDELAVLETQRGAARRSEAE